MKALCAFLILAVGFTGCARQADVGHPERFKEGALGFDYPGNWTVTMNEALGEGRMVMLEDSGSALVTITVYPPGVDVSLADYGRTLKEKMTDSALGMLMSMKGQELFQGTESLEFKFTVAVAGVRVPHTQEVTRHVFGGFTLFCMSQTADEDRHLVQAGFDLVRGSLAIQAVQHKNHP